MKVGLYIQRSNSSSIEIIIIIMCTIKYVYSQWSPRALRRYHTNVISLARLRLTFSHCTNTLPFIYYFVAFPEAMLPAIRYRTYPYFIRFALSVLCDSSTISFYTFLSFIRCPSLSFNALLFGASKSMRTADFFLVFIWTRKKPLATFLGSRHFSCARLWMPAFLLIKLVPEMKVMRKVWFVTAQRIQIGFTWRIAQETPSIEWLNKRFVAEIFDCRRS